MRFLSLLQEVKENMASAMIIRNTFVFIILFLVIHLS
jgi:hypothetical protein